MFPAPGGVREYHPGWAFNVVENANKKIKNIELIKCFILLEV